MCKGLSSAVYYFSFFTYHAFDSIAYIIYDLRIPFVTHTKHVGLMILLVLLHFLRKKGTVVQYSHRIY